MAELLYAHIPPAIAHKTITPSSTKANHSSDGADVTLTATAHGLAAGTLIKLAGWTWSDGGGDINHTYVVKSVAANTITFTPADGSGGTVPTGATNPSVVGTVVEADESSCCRIPVVAGVGARIVLPSGLWSVRNSAYNDSGVANAVELGWRKTKGTSDVTLPDSAFAADTVAARKAGQIEAGMDEVIEIRHENVLILDVPSGTVVVFIRPSPMKFR